MRLVDTHCHLYDAPLGADPASVVARARAAGVEALIVVGTTLQTSRQAVALAAALPGVWAAVGIHPDADELYNADVDSDSPVARDHRDLRGPRDLIDALAALLPHPKVVAVGEIGLDGSQGRARLVTQQPLCRAQLALARDHHLPALVHSRDATAPLLRLLQEFGPGGPGGILHAYAGSRETAAQAHRLGFHIGVAGVVSWPQARRIRAILADLPLDQLVLETDAPYIGTAAHRHHTVEPAHLPEICHALATLKNVDPDAVATTTTATARRLLPRLSLSPSS